LLFPILQNLKKSKKIDLKLAVTGSHLNKGFGLTYKKIIKDNFKIDYKIPILGNQNNLFIIINAISNIIRKFYLILKKSKPNFVLVLGDRYEIFGAVIAAANGDQKALEGSRDGGSELQNGFFSSSFIEAIQRNLSIRELKPYIENQVLQLSGGEQKPFARQELFKIDWELIRACNDARNMD
jgi:hypothetical protein